MAEGASWPVSEIQARVAALGWFHDWEIVPGVRTNGMSSMERVCYFPIPEDLTGKRILDVGCADGFFTFLAESRGAQVVAVDAWPRESFFLAHEILHSKAEFHHASVYDLRAEDLGFFDLVFFFGVYYHLKNPILALERIASVTRGWALIESEIALPSSLPKVVLEPGLQEDERALGYFIEHDELNNDPTNWWIPNVPCLLQTIRAAGFPRAEVVCCYEGSRCIVRAVKGPRTATKALAENIFVAIDRPTSSAVISGQVEVGGWAMNLLHPADESTRVWVYLDHLDDPGCELGEAEYGLVRPDQIRYFGERQGNCGYRFSWNPARVAPGIHTLHVMVEGESGWNYRSVVVTISSDSCSIAEPTAEMNHHDSEEAESESTLLASRGDTVLNDLAKEIEAQADVALRSYRVRSKVPLFGPLIAWVRRHLTSHLREPYLDPIIEQQVSLNRQMAEWLKQAGATLDASVQCQGELRHRIKALEAQMSDLGRRLGDREWSQKHVQRRD